MVSLLPVKSKKLIIKERDMHYLVLCCGDEVYIQQRSQKDIWQGLYEFFLIESPLDYQESEDWQQLYKYVKNTDDLDFESRQKLTHQLIKSKFHLIHLHTKPTYKMQGIWVQKDLLKKYPFPKTILSFLNRKKYF